MDESDVARFWSRVDKDGPIPAHMPHLGQCWIWTWTKNRQKYGWFYVPGRNSYQSHRFSWEITNGPPGELWVLHKCDNPSCVRPDHLFLGTVIDNTRDRDAKGRLNPVRGDACTTRKHPEYVQGEKNGMAKLTAEEVRAIRDATGFYKDIGLRFGISPAQVGRIQRRILWKHVT